jgi:hypothetical protein
MLVTKISVNTVELIIMLLNTLLNGLLLVNYLFTGTYLLLSLGELILFLMVMIVELLVVLTQLIYLCTICTQLVNILLLFMVLMLMVMMHHLHGDSLYGVVIGKMLLLKTYKL